MPAKRSAVLFALLLPALGVHPLSAHPVFQGCSSETAGAPGTGGGCSVINPPVTDGAGSTPMPGNGLVYSLVDPQVPGIGTNDTAVGLVVGGGGTF
jgi:hypothetical protein